MDFRYKLWAAGLCAVSAILTGCGGTSGSGSQTTPPPPPPTTFQLTVTSPPANAGKITSAPEGISCPGTCTASFAAGTQVKLTAAAGASYFFTGWAGGCTGTSTCTVSTTATVSATFTPGFGIAVTLAGKGTGSVTSNPAVISCSSASGAICSSAFPQGTLVTLSETTTGTNTFGGWSGACTGTGTTCQVTVSGASNVTATFNVPVTGIQNLNHIILFADENRSLDHYFGFMRQYWASKGITDQSFDGLPQFNPISGIAPLQGPVPAVPGCNLSIDVTSCSPDPTNPIQSFSFHSLVLPSGKLGTVCEENQSPFWNEAHNDWDYTNPADQPAEVDAQGNPNPPLNGFAFTAAYDARSNAFMDVNGVRAMGYFEDSDLNFYYSLATDFATSDRWFSPVMDRTQINRAYIYAATSQGYAYPPGGGNNDNHAFTAKTIFEALQDAGITWKIYVDPTNVFWTNPATLVTENCSTEAAGEAQDLCLAGSSYMNQFVYETQIQNTAANPTLWQHFAPISQFKIDLGDDATFPQFAYIEPASSAGLDEHPSDADISPVNVQLGASYVYSTIVQPFVSSPTWTDSAMIFTYDEAGGLYDHVPPQPVPAPGDENSPTDLLPGDICDNPGQLLGAGTCTFGWTGYRVPLVVISPYSRQNFVSHTVRDTTAVLALVEERFGLKQLTNRDGYYLPTASGPGNSMDEFFDFVNKPWAVPPPLVTQSLTGNCDQTPAVGWNEPPEITVTITGGGNVSSNPAFTVGACTTECTGVYATATVVPLTATPNTGSTFTGWSGACTGAIPTCSVTVGAGQQFVTATFNP